MTRLTLFAALFAMAANAGLPTAAQAADACDLMVAKLTASDGVQFERRTDEGTIFLKHPLSNALTIECEPGWRPTNVYVGWPNAFPTAAFYTFLGRVGSVVADRSASLIEASAKRCHVAALKARNENAEVHGDGVELDCQAFTRNGGASNFTILPE